MTVKFDDMETPNDMKHPKIVSRYSALACLLCVGSAAIPGHTPAVTIVTAVTTQQNTARGVRRLLPKPPQGSRGFEQYAGNDASSRLIAAGATRGGDAARRPVAPLEGVALDPRPFFLWEPAPNKSAYRFVLYEGDIFEDPRARIVYEIEVSSPQLIYPASAPKLTPGALYSWRVVAPASSVRDGSSGSKTQGMSARFFVLVEEDAAAVRRALSAGTTATKPSASRATNAVRLRRARVLADHGVWYDTLLLARELVAENPDDRDVQAFYGSLIERLDQ